MRTTILSGGASVGKTAVLRHIVAHALAAGRTPAVCKIDCVDGRDAQLFSRMGALAVAGVSADICPDHFLVSNLPELWEWAERSGAQDLFIETAGLCHRCSPATANMLAGCVVDATASCEAPARLGPMLTHADFAVVTKIDMVSQAEREIIVKNLAELAGGRKAFCVDSHAGYGTDALMRHIFGSSRATLTENDTLRHPMPSGVCSYCVGEMRVGAAFQQGVVGKIDFTRSEVRA